MTLLNDTGLSLRGRFKFARLAAGLEQEQLAQRIGVSRSTISNWERGLAEPNASHFIQLAEAVGQPLDYFAEGLKYTPRDSNPEPTD